MSRSGFELTLARRLAWKQPGAERVSPAVGVAVTGVALSVMVMLLSIAIMSGFKHEVRGKILALDDAITITGYDPSGAPKAFPADEPMRAFALPDGAIAEQRNRIAGILKTPTDFMGVTLSGNDGMIPPDSLNSIALSRTQAAALGLSRGDMIPAYFFIDNRLRARSLRVDSIYQTGIADHDAAVAFCSSRLPGVLNGLPEDYVQAIGIKGIDPEQIEPLASAIHGSLLSAYYAGELTSAYALTDIFQTNSQFFSWLSLIDTNVIVILSLMGAVAAFTLISSLFIIILERVKTIGLLKALGASNRQIGRVFIMMAERLVLRGLLIGNLAALLIIGVQHFTGVIPLDPASYYVDHVPVRLTLWALFGVNCAVLAVSWLVLMLPAMVISRISPASTMRYE